MMKKSGACFWYLYMMHFFFFKDKESRKSIFLIQQIFFFYLKVFSRILQQNIIKCPAINFKSASQGHVLQHISLKQNTAYIFCMGYSM